MPYRRPTQNRDFAAMMQRPMPSAGHRETRYIGGLAPAQLKRVTDYMLIHIADDIPLSEMAEQARLSLFHFCRAFKKSTGVSPRTFLAQLRIDLAQETMRVHPEFGLTDIAVSVGYQSQSSFGKAFKHWTGTTPSQWRKDQAW